jgi:hypothetical protein
MIRSFQLLKTLRQAQCDIETYNTCHIELVEMCLLVVFLGYSQLLIPNELN